jgi:hypothetical protein
VRGRLTQVEAARAVCRLVAELDHAAVVARLVRDVLGGPGDGLRLACAPHSGRRGLDDARIVDEAALDVLDELGVRRAACLCRLSPGPRLDDIADSQVVGVLSALHDLRQRRGERHDGQQRKQECGELHGGDEASGR